MPAVHLATRVPGACELIWFVNLVTVACRDRNVRDTSLDVSSPFPKTVAMGRFTDTVNEPLGGMTQFMCKRLSQPLGIIEHLHYYDVFDSTSMR